MQGYAVDDASIGYPAEGAVGATVVVAPVVVAAGAIDPGIAGPGAGALVWRRRWWIAAAVLTGLLIAVIILETATYRYTASLKVTPVQANTSSLPGGLSSLSALAGVSIGRGDVVKPFILYVQTVKGRGVAVALARQPQMMHHIFAAQWDAAGRRWHPAPSLTGGLSTGFQRLVGVPIPGWHPPGAAEVQEWLEKRLGTQEDPKNGVAVVTLSDVDPAFATRVLTTIHQVADDLLRARTLQRTSNYIAYLQATLPTVTLVEHRQDLANILADQEKQRMIASATGSAFAAEPLGAVTVSDRPTTPDAPLVLLGGVAGGALIGLLAAMNWPLRTSRRGR